MQSINKEHLNKGPTREKYLPTLSMSPTSKGEVTSLTQGKYFSLSEPKVYFLILLTAKTQSASAVKLSKCLLLRDMYTKQNIRHSYEDAHLSHIRLFIIKSFFKQTSLRFPLPQTSPQLNLAGTSSNRINQQIPFGCRFYKHKW